MEKQNRENVNHPACYNIGTIEVIVLLSHGSSTFRVVAR